MLHDYSHCVNGSVPFPQWTIEALRRIQAHPTSTVLSSIYIYDLVEQRTLCTSCSVAAMLGYASEAIHAMEPIGLADLIHPEDLDQVAEHYQRFTTLLYGEVITLEYRMRRADGTWCRLRSQETPLVQAIDGFPLQILGMVQEMTPISTPTPGNHSLFSRLFRRRRSTHRVETSAARQKRLPLSKSNQSETAS